MCSSVVLLKYILKLKFLDANIYCTVIAIIIISIRAIAVYLEIRYHDCLFAIIEHYCDKVRHEGAKR